MKYLVLAVGRLKERAAADLAADYLKRIGRYAGCRMQEVKAGGSGDRKAVIRIEGERLLAALENRDTVVVCDERGRQFTTPELSGWISDRAAAGGSGRMVIVVGGADGLADEVRDRADLILGLSRLTLPHELARVVLLEQLYRVLTLQAGHPYHRA
jgi:23S rRNA (pseudouridine1915-N3)-methyltransferase